MLRLPAELLSCDDLNLVPVAVALTQGSDVAVASVAGAFPSGLSSLEVRLTDIAEAVCAGAHEVDVVPNRAAFVAGDHAIVSDELHAIADHTDQVGKPVELKISGGVRTSADALGCLAIIEATLGSDWLTPSRVRFGASGLLTTLVTDLAAINIRDD